MLLIMQVLFNNENTVWDQGDGGSVSVRQVNAHDH